MGIINGPSYAQSSNSGRGIINGPALTEPPPDFEAVSAQLEVARQQTIAQFLSDPSFSAWRDTTSDPIVTTPEWTPEQARRLLLLLSANDVNTSLAPDAFGTSLGDSFVSAMQPVDNRAMLNASNQVADLDCYSNVPDAVPQVQSSGEGGAFGGFDPNDTSIPPNLLNRPGVMFRTGGGVPPPPALAYGPMQGREFQVLPDVKAVMPVSVDLGSVAIPAQGQPAVPAYSSTGDNPPSTNDGWYTTPEGVVQQLTYSGDSVVVTAKRDPNSIDSDATAVDSMGQPLYGRSNYNAWDKGSEIIGGFFGDPVGTVGKLGDWLTYTTADAQRLRTEISAMYGPDPRYALIDQVAASPLGGAAYGITNLAGASPETQHLALGSFTALDGLLMSGTAAKRQVPSFLGAQRAGVFETPSPHALTTLDNLAGRAPADKMQMGIRFESVQSTLDSVSRYGGQTATQAYMRAFDGNGGLVPGSVRMDMVGRAPDGGFDLFDYKLTHDAPLTTNQGLHYPAFAQYGGLVTGLRGAEIGLPRGRILPPTTVNMQIGPLPVIRTRE